MSENVITLRWSSISSFSRCQRRYKLNYVDLIERKPNAETRNRILGSHIHAGLQAALDYSFHFAKSSQSEDDLVDQAVQAMRVYNRDTTEPNKTIYDYQQKRQVRDDDYYQMMVDVLIQATLVIRYQLPRIGIGTRYRVATVGEVIYPDWEPYNLDEAPDVPYKHRDPMIEWRFEEHFDYDVSGQGERYDADAEEYVNEWINEYSITGTVDTIFFDNETGAYVLFDWKSRGAMPREDLVDLDGQLKLYAAVINRIAGRPVINRTVQYEMRTTVPKPAVLTEKKRQLSLARCASTWEVWSDSVRGLGLDPEPYYEEMQDKLRDPIEYTNPISTPVTKAQSFHILRNALQIGEAIRFAERTGSFPALPSHTNCQFCDYKSYCRTHDNAGDLNWILAEDYQPVTKIEDDVLEDLDDAE